MTTDDHRAAYLAGDSSVLDAEERRALDGIRGVLADPAVWEDPRAGLEAEIVAAISEPAGSEAPHSRYERRVLDRRRLLAVAAAAAVGLAVATITIRSWHGKARRRSTAQRP